MADQKGPNLPIVYGIRALEAKELWQLALIALCKPPRPPPIETASEKASIGGLGIIDFASIHIAIIALILYHSLYHIK